jgi:signal transduction histidine kinase
MMFRLLNWQGAAGIAVAFTLLIMLTVQKLDAVHWKKQSATFEQLYQKEQAAFALTVANARAAADVARADDKANADRVAAEQRAINERAAHDYETRLAAARAAAERLRLGTATTADSRAGRGSSMPGLPASPDGAAQGADQDQFSRSDRLTATEQAIQLDELINWVRQQAGVTTTPR